MTKIITFAAPEENPNVDKINGIIVQNTHGMNLSRKFTGFASAKAHLEQIGRGILLYGLGINSNEPANARYNFFQSPSELNKLYGPGLRLLHIAQQQKKPSVLAYSAQGEIPSEVRARAKSFNARVIYATPEECSELVRTCQEVFLR